MIGKPPLVTALDLGDLRIVETHLNPPALTLDIPEVWPSSGWRRFEVAVTTASGRELSAVVMCSVVTFLRVDYQSLTHASCETIRFRFARSSDDLERRSSF